jgi:hypothetical protein
MQLGAAENKGGGEGAAGTLARTGSEQREALLVRDDGAKALGVVSWRLVTPCKLLFQRNSET